MGRLTTHVLDTARGCPGAGIPVELYSAGDERRCLKATVTNADGRTDEPLLEGDSLVAGTFELVFRVGAYFAGAGLALSDPPFLDEISLRFAVASAEEHYHVPLLVSPWSYSTYRGS